MQITTALMKHPADIRVSSGDRWLYFDQHTGEWVVLQRKYYARENVVLCRSFLQKEAVKALLGEDGTDIDPNYEAAKSDLTP